MPHFNCVWVGFKNCIEKGRLITDVDAASFLIVADSESIAEQLAWERVKTYPDRIKYANEMVFSHQLKAESLRKILDESESQIIALKNNNAEAILDVDYLEA